jgi:hypothetical protein
MMIRRSSSVLSSWVRQVHREMAIASPVAVPMISETYKTIASSPFAQLQRHPRKRNYLISDIRDKETELIKKHKTVCFYISDVRKKHATASNYAITRGI